MRQLVLPLLLTALPLSAQRLHEARWSDDSLHIKFTLVEDKQAGSDYAVWTTPQLTDEQGNQLALPVSIFRGKRNQRLHERQRHYEPKTLRPLPAQGLACEGALGDTIDYALDFDRKTYPWMWENRIVLSTQREREGCCEVDSLSGQTIARLLYIPPFRALLAPVEDNTGKAGELQRTNPVLQHISKYRPYDKSRVMYKEKEALFVHFELDRHRLLHDFRDNAPTLNRIVDITRQILADTTSTVKLIQIIGMASVEGPAARNERLAANRAKALKEYIQQHVVTPDSLYELANGGEAWTELRAALEESDFEDKAELLDIIDNTADPNLRERKIKRLHGGRTYAYLRDHVLANQRNSGYLRIYYDYVADKVAPAINRATALLQEAAQANAADSDLAKDARVDEALRLLLTVHQDARAYNALGVAYWYKGNRTEAQRYFTMAVENGNVQAKENLKQTQEIERRK